MERSPDVPCVNRTSSPLWSSMTLRACCFIPVGIQIPLSQTTFSLQHFNHLSLFHRSRRRSTTPPPPVPLRCSDLGVGSTHLPPLSVFILPNRTAFAEHGEFRGPRLWQFELVPTHTAPRYFVPPHLTSVASLYSTSFDRAQFAADNSTSTGSRDASRTRCSASSDTYTGCLV